MTVLTPSEGHGFGLPTGKAESMRDELYELHGLTVALDHCLFACGFVMAEGEPHDALTPLVSTLKARLHDIAFRLDQELTGNKEPTA